MLAAAVAVIQMSGGDSAQGVVQNRGNTTTKNAVINALASTGYELKYRKTPRVEGYEVVSGQAFQGSDSIEFTVEIRRAGSYEDMKKAEFDPQPPILRYAGMTERQTVGNIIYGTKASAPNYPGREYELETSPRVLDMESNVEIALRKLFAARFVPGP